MSKLIIDWNWQYLPANSDVVTPLAHQEIQGKEVWLFYNHTEKQMVFEFDGYYGVLLVEPDEEVSHEADDSLSAADSSSMRVPYGPISGDDPSRPADGGTTP